MSERATVAFEIHEDGMVPEFAPLTFRQKSAAWFGRPVKPHFAYFIDGRRIYCHPSNGKRLRAAIDPRTIFVGDDVPMLSWRQDRLRIGEFK